MTTYIYEFYVPNEKHSVSNSTNFIKLTEEEIKEKQLYLSEQWNCKIDEVRYELEAKKVDKADGY